MEEGCVSHVVQTALRARKQFGARKKSDQVCAVKVTLQFSSVAHLCSTLCDPVDCTVPGFPVHHQLPELAQT